MKTLGLLVFLLLPLGLMAQELTEEDYRIYRTFLEQYGGKTEQKSQIRFFVKPQTVVSFGSGSLRLNSQDIRWRVRTNPRIRLGMESFSDSTAWYQLVDQYVDSSFVSVPLESVQLNQGRIQAMPWSQELDEQFFKKGEGWYALRRTFPNSAAISAFSQIRSDGTHALFYYETVSDYETGEGVWVLMRREPSGWKLVLTLLLWIS